MSILISTTTGMAPIPLFSGFTVVMVPTWEPQQLITNIAFQVISVTIDKLLLGFSFETSLSNLSKKSALRREEPVELFKTIMIIMWTRWLSCCLQGAFAGVPRWASGRMVWPDWVGIAGSISTTKNRNEPCRSTRCTERKASSLHEKR